MMKNNMPTIGIAGVGLPSTLYCIERISHYCQNHFPPLTHPNIIMHTPNLAPTYQAEITDHWDQVATYLLESITLLAKAGVDFAIIPANAVHKVIKDVQKQAPIKVLDLLDEVTHVCAARAFKKVGIVGTSWTTAGHYYQSRLAAHKIEEIIPNPEQQIVFQNAIMKELVPTAKIRPETLQELLTIIKQLKQKGCDAIALACTELPLVLNEQNCGLPTIDTTSVLAEAAIREALQLMK